MKKNSQYFDSQVDNNISKTIDDFASEIKILKYSLDAQHNYRESYSWILGATDLSNLGLAETPIYSALIKNEFALYSCLKLTNEGLYGSARMLLRSIYEGLMIAKYASISQSERFIRKWKKGETIYFSNSVLKNIKEPEFIQLGYIWKTLCNYSHATVYAQQISIEYDELENELSTNYGVMMILLNCNYHLLNRHFVTPSVQYYTKRYRKEWDGGKSKESAQKAYKTVNATLTSTSKAAIREFKATWKLK